MDQLHHELWITHAVNVVLGPIAAAVLALFGYHVPAGEQVIPDYLAMLIVITALFTVLCLLVRARLSVESPGRAQLLLEDFVGVFNGMLEDIIGPTGRKYLPLVGTVFLLIWVSNMAGLVPGMMAPTSNMNVTLGCAVTVWVYYHIEGVRQQGLFSYLKHFVLPPGTPVWLMPLMVPLMLLIESISHTSRVLSLSLRLFGNVFGEELVIIIIASIIPFVVPLPMMFLGVITGTLQAVIFAILTMVYLGGAVAVEHEHAAQH